MAELTRETKLELRERIEEIKALVGQKRMSDVQIVRNVAKNDNGTFVSLNISYQELSKTTEETRQPMTINEYLKSLTEEI